MDDWDRRRALSHGTIGVTEARLMLLPLDRYIQPKGPPILLPPEALEFTRSRVATLIRRRGRTRPI